MIVVTVALHSEVDSRIEALGTVIIDNIGGTKTLHQSR
jgi:hypothetical protein